MAGSSSTFSESWHRVASQRIYLRAGVRVHRQHYRGERWIVLENPFGNQFFRLRPVAYEFVARLRPERTVAEVWQQCLERFPDEAPGQEAVIQLLSQLYFANLLHYDQAFDSTQLFERYKKRRQKELTGRLLSIMFMRFPLLDPDAFLVRTMPVVGKLISKGGGLLWLAVVGLALKVVADNFSALLEQGQAVLAPGNLPLLYVSLILIKTLHEFGHAYMCRKFGGEVHVMGILLMIFTPVPYVDATSSWGFPSKWQRILVGAAGMIVELFVAALAVLVWAGTSPGLVHSLAYNIIFIASVSTILFNVNPLMRFDGYYLLSDWLEIPNLSQRSYRHLRHLWEHYVFGMEKSESPALTHKEAVWLTIYGIASGIYRVFLFTGILLFVADRLLILGLIMLVICAVSWVIVPLGKFIHYLASSPKIERIRTRAIAVTCGLIVFLLLLLAVIPFPSHFRAPGVVEARQHTTVVNEVDGTVHGLLAEPGSSVQAGQPLVQLDNPELELKLADVRARLQETRARLLDAMSSSTADIKSLQKRMDALNERLNKLLKDHGKLRVCARHQGIWVAPGVRDSVGQQLPAGSPLGIVVDSSAFEFAATVLQVDADTVFVQAPRGAEIRLFSAVGTAIPVRQLRIVPGGSRALPSVALGWGAGGDLAVFPDKPDQATEPFFELRADIVPTAGVSLVHGMSGKMRFDLKPEPLLPRWLRRLRQLLQKRYQL